MVSDSLHHDLDSNRFVDPTVFMGGQTPLTMSQRTQKEASAKILGWLLKDRERE
jgi:hypothetical protein